MLKLKHWINCKVFGLHEWTCKANEGIAPTYNSSLDIKAQFKEYAKMYCKHCGKESKLNNKL